MNVRLAVASDVAAVRDLETEAFGFTWDESTFLKEFQRPDCLFTVGEVEGGTVAMASLHWVLDEVHLVSIAVAPAYRGQGLSRVLLGVNMAFARLREELRWMTLEVKWDNPPALALYKSYGFTTVGKRKKYYRDGQDARIMFSGEFREERYVSALARYEAEAERLMREWKDTRP